MCDVSDSNLWDPYIDILLASSTFLCLSGACTAFVDLRTWSICLICSSTFNCQLIMITLTNEPCKVNFRSEKGKLARDLQCRPGQELQDQKDELKARAGSSFKRSPTSGLGPGLPGRPSNNQSVAEYRDAIEWKAALDAEAIRMLKKLTDEQATMARPAAWRPREAMDEVARN
jgi:hypothetical protein